MNIDQLHSIYLIDKDKYPNKVYYFNYQGYKCEIKRNYFEFYCGYIYLNNDHPLCNKSMDDLEKLSKYSPHGGFTYTEGNKIGFDCGHLSDYIPSDTIYGFNKSLGFENIYKRFRTFEDVEKEIKKIVDSFN